ncbi:hypothetical protein [Methylobacterium sp. CM6257]
MPDFDEHLAREFVQGLVGSALARGLDPAARLQQFRILQQAVAAMTRDPVLAETAARLVRVIDRTL